MYLRLCIQILRVFKCMNSMATSINIYAFNCHMMHLVIQLNTFEVFVLLY